MFHNQLIHCDPGRERRARLPRRERRGRLPGRRSSTFSSGTRDNWFRPSDVCVAPDGSLFVADWYDPGVGGHRMGDITRGRIFRVAPPQDALPRAAPRLLDDPGRDRGAQEPQPRDALSRPGRRSAARRDRGRAGFDAAVRTARTNPRIRPARCGCWRSRSRASRQTLHRPGRLPTPNPDIRATAVARLAPKVARRDLPKTVASLVTIRRPKSAANARSPCGTSTVPQRARAVGRVGRSVRRPRSLVSRSAGHRSRRRLGRLPGRVAEQSRPDLEFAGRPRHRLAVARGEDARSCSPEFIEDPATPAAELPRVSAGLRFPQRPGEGAESWSTWPSATCTAASET